MVYWQAVLACTTTVWRSRQVDADFFTGDQSPEQWWWSGGGGVNQGLLAEVRETQRVGGWVGVVIEGSYSSR